MRCHCSSLPPTCDGRLPGARAFASRRCRLELLCGHAVCGQKVFSRRPRTPKVRGYSKRGIGASIQNLYSLYGGVQFKRLHHFTYPMRNFRSDIKKPIWRYSLIRRRRPTRRLGNSPNGPLLAAASCRKYIKKIPRRKAGGSKSTRITGVHRAEETLTT